MIFQLFAGAGGVPDGCGGSLFVSFLHTGETVPAGSDPVSGKEETAFCFTSTAAEGTGRNHGAVAAHVS